MRCGVCDVPLTASWSTGKAGIRYPYYHCRNRDCRAITVRKEVLESTFLAWLGELSVPEPLFDLMEAVAEELFDEARARVQSAHSRLLEALGDLESRQDRLVDAYLAGSGIDEATFRRQCERMEAEKIALRNEITVIPLDRASLSDVLFFARELLKDLPKSWNTLEPLQRQPFLRAMVPSGLTYTNGVVGTPQTPWCVRGITELTTSDISLAPPTGFEPVPPP